MRRLFPLLLAALAACQVDVEGAPCRTDHAEDCPAGQACGLDQRCSTRAAKCTICTPGEGRCNGERFEECSAADDPVCGAWSTLWACEGGFVCGEKSGAASCECPPNDGPEFAADPAGSRTVGAAPYPTGAESPVACRFGRLGDALAAAATYAEAHPGEAAIARASGTASVNFGVEGTGETFPLVVGAGVTLVGPADSTRATIRLDDPAASAGVELRGAIERVNLENLAAVRVGVAASCGEIGRPSLRHVAIRGAALLQSGIAVSGSCGADLEEVEVEAAAGPALLVEASGEEVVSVLGGAFRNSGTGIEVTGGTVTVEGPHIPLQLLSGFADGTTLEIVGNAGHGVALTGGATPIVFSVSRARIHENRGTGVRIDELPTGSSVSITQSDIGENLGVGEGSLYATGRSAGGLILSQSAPPPFVFAGNVVACNGGDQLGFYTATETPLRIGPDACGTGSNFVRTKPQGIAVFVSGYATVDARNNYWAPDPPTTAGSLTYRYTCEATPAPPACP
jgi:hypothetical protein